MALYHCSVYFFLGLYIIHLTSAVPLESYYHLVTEVPICDVAARQNQSLDLVCQYFDRPDSNGGCVAAAIVWKKLGLPSAVNITDSNKYGIWEAIPGKGLSPNEHVSLLRIRHFSIEDIGRYQCEIHCRADKVGYTQLLHHYADVCLQQVNDNHAICGTQEPECSSSFWNGACDPTCDNEENLYDGFDCAPMAKPCPPMLEEYCQNAFANRICNKECDSGECGWDGGDCILSEKRNNYAKDVVVLVLRPNYNPGVAGLDFGLLGKRLSQLLGPETIVQVIPDDWLTKDPEAASLGPEDVVEKDITFPKSKIYLTIDNNKCQSRCFTNAKYTARFLETAIDNGWDPGIPIGKVGVLGPVVNNCLLKNNTLLGIHSSPEEKISSVHPAGKLPRLHEQEDGLPWLVTGLTAAVGVLLLALPATVCFIGRYRRRTRKQFSYSAEAEVFRIKAATDAPAGTDV